MAPNTPQEWLAVANERAADAEAMLPSRTNSVGPVYMIGYAIECTLKAYLRSQNKPFPAHGTAGHNLKGLWQACGFRLYELRDRTGHKTFFIQSWGTHLRYEQVLSGSFSSESLVNEGKKLAGWIEKQIRQQKGRRRR
ncbi:MAG: hypothetical protein ACPGWR_24640 [Ardenticatenaceae bacterium]